MPPDWPGRARGRRPALHDVGRGCLMRRLRGATEESPCVGGDARRGLGADPPGLRCPARKPLGVGRRKDDPLEINLLDKPHDVPRVNPLPYSMALLCSRKMPRSAARGSRRPVKNSPSLAGHAPCVAWASRRRSSSWCRKLWLP